MDVIIASDNSNTSLNTMFNKIQSNLKTSQVHWDDFLGKTAKLHSAIKNVLLCSGLFWESFQKIADTATESQGSTKEIGTSFTRLCMRQRLIESKLKTLNHHLIVSLSNPIQERLEEWKRLANQIDKDRIKGTKKAKAEWKKASGESLRLQKKAVKRGSMRGLGSLQTEVEGALRTQAEKHSRLEQVEQSSLTRLMTHERGRFCELFRCLRPVLDCEVGLLEDISSLDGLVTTLEMLTSAEQPPSSGIGSRKSSVASSLNSSSGSSMFSRGSNSHSSLLVNGTKAPALPNRHESLSRIDLFYKQVFQSSTIQKVAGGTEINTATSSTQEASGYSGDYRVSDDENRHKLSRDAEEDDTEEDDEEEDEDEDEEEESEEDEEAKTPSSPSMSLWSGKLSAHADSGHHKYNNHQQQQQRHTVSGARGEHARGTVTAELFEPPTDSASRVSQSSLDHSRQLYPNQAIPLPVYTNLRELTNAAQRKFSMTTGPTSIMTSSMTNSNAQNCVPSSNTQEHYAAPNIGGSKTPSLRRMTLPEICPNKPPMNRETTNETPMSNNTLTRQQSDQPTNYRTPSTGTHQHRSVSVNEHYRSPHYATPSTITTNTTPNITPTAIHYLSELEHHLSMSSNSPSTDLDLDLDLPMPPPPSSVDEEIRLAQQIQHHNFH